MRYVRWLVALTVAAGAMAAVAQVETPGGNGQFRDIPPRPAQAAPPAPMIVAMGDWNASAEDQAADKAAREALDKPLSKFAAAQLPLAEVLANFSKDVGVNVTVEWVTLEAMGVAKSTRVTVNMEHTTARRVLREILVRANAAAPANLGFTVDGGNVVVTGREDLEAERFQTTRAYDVGFLFADVELKSDAAEELRGSLTTTIEQTFEPETWRDAGGRAGAVHYLGATMLVHARGDIQVEIGQLVDSLRAGTRGSLRNYDVHDLVGDDKGRIEKLIDVIQTSCGRETWRGKGGSSGSIAAFDGKLYINASPAVHQQIENLLALMRKK